MDISQVTTNFGSSPVGENANTKTTDVKESVHSDTELKTASELNKQNEEEIKEQLKDTVKKLNIQMDMLNTNIKFGFSDEIEAMYVKVHEKSSGRLIRKFPTDEAMKLAKHMKEFIGILFDKKG